MREALDGHDAEVARWAALVLGAHCRPEATELLVRMVLERDEAVPPHTGFVQPRWVSALVCLRYLADPRLNDVIAGTLETELDYPGHWLHALKALGRAGDPKAVPLIRDFLQSVRQKNRYWDERSIPSSGAGWRIELVAAEALIQLGDDQAADLARRYADDARLPVRRYARQILACAGLPTVTAGAAR